MVRRYKEGDIIGVISYDYDSAKHLEKLLKAKLKAKLKDEAKIFGATKLIISLENIKDVDHVLIDDLDLVLGDKCVCATTNGVVNVISDTYVDSETSYKEVYNQKNTSKKVERFETEKPMSIIECCEELLKKYKLLSDTLCYTGFGNELLKTLDINIARFDYNEWVDKTNKVLEFVEAFKQLTEAHKNREDVIGE